MHKLSSDAFRKLLLASLTALFLLPLAVLAQPRPVMNAAETELALKKLSVLGSALYVGAHPDDENTAMLAYLSRGRLVRAAYLSVTRGDGGQNLIGTEQGELLGLLRTEELLAARRIDGAEQFFTRAIDFGFSKNPEEALRIWGHEEVLADVVWAIRRFRPDVIITRFPTSGAGGHGHHTASAILAEEAFAAAADPARFPEQLRDTKVWQARRLLWNYFGKPPETAAADAPRIISLDLGAYNPLLGKSYTEIAALSRSMHKSQGFGSAERRGTAVNYLQLIKGDAPRSDMFDGIDTSWRRIAGGEAVGALLEEAARTFRTENPSASLPLLLRAYAAIQRLQTNDPLVATKRAELLEVVRACAGLWIEAVAGDFYVTPGGDLRANVTLVNRSDYPLRLENIELPYGTPAKAVGAELKNNQPLQTEVVLSVPEGSDYNQPYWMVTVPDKGRYSVARQHLIGLPENPPPLAVTLNISAREQNTGEQVPLVFQTPILFRWTDRVRGEQYRPVEIVPPVSINFEEGIYVFPEQKTKTVRLLLKSNSAQPVSGRLHLDVTGGWGALPDEIPVNLKNKGDELTATFTVSPPVNPSATKLSVAFYTPPGNTLTRSLVTIEHEHIPIQTLFPHAQANAVRLDLQKRGQRIAYIMGSGDEVPQALRQVGYEVALLSDEDLDKTNFKNFDAVVTGVRAYNTRPRLRQQQRRLLEYVEGGGTLVVQYNTDDLNIPDLGPYPFKLSRNDRVTVEEAPVKFLLPEHPLLQTPNRITAADFDNWVQERGLQFPGEWDARYETLFSMNDPGESEKRGSTLVARYGRGTYIYTSLAWFRQLPAGVPGAYRLFVNMISAGK